MSTPRILIDDDEPAILPSGHALCLDRADCDDTLFAKRVFLDNRPVEADEESLRRLRNLQ